MKDPVVTENIIQYKLQDDSEQELKTLNLYSVIHDLWRSLQETISYVFTIKQFNISMNPTLTGYRVIGGFVINALLWTARRKSPYVTLNQLQLEQSTGDSTRNLRHSQMSSSMGCGQWRYFRKST